MYVVYIHGCSILCVGFIYVVVESKYMLVSWWLNWYVFKPCIRRCVNGVCVL